MPHRLWTPDGLDKPARFTEPAFIQDVFSDGLAYAEPITEDVLRFVFAVKQRCCFTGETEHVIVSKLVIPREGAIYSNRLAARAMRLRYWGSLEG